MMKKPETDPDQKKITRIYALFGVSLVLSLVPMISAALVSLSLGMGVLVTAYVLRTGSEEGGLLDNHMTYIIRTLWIGGLVALVSLAAASAYLFQSLDNTPLHSCLDGLLSMAATTIVPDKAMLDYITNGPCWLDYWKTNIKVFVVSGVMAAGPVLLYFLARYARGLGRAMRGYRVAKPKAWF